MLRMLVGCGLIGCLCLGCAEPPPPAGGSGDTPAMDQSGTTDAVSSNGGASSATTLVSLKVPNMDCPFGCWPAVRESLTAVDGVESVELAQQGGQDVIDNPVVMIKTGTDFDPSQLISALPTRFGQGAELLP
jgi:periplasmic mercuric ion binding protein